MQLTAVNYQRFKTSSSDCSKCSCRLQFASFCEHSQSNSWKMSLEVVISQTFVSSLLSETTEEDVLCP
jgi:hypothetical protein